MTIQNKLITTLDKIIDPETGEVEFKGCIGLVRIKLIMRPEDNFDDIDKILTDGDQIVSASERWSLMIDDEPGEPAF